MGTSALVHRAINCYEVLLQYVCTVCIGNNRITIRIAAGIFRPYCISMIARLHLIEQRIIINVTAKQGVIIVGNAVGITGNCLPFCTKAGMNIDRYLIQHVISCLNDTFDQEVTPNQMGRRHGCTGNRNIINQIPEIPCIGCFDIAN